MAQEITATQCDPSQVPRLRIVDDVSIQTKQKSGKVVIDNCGRIEFVMFLMLIWWCVDETTTRFTVYT
jgi:hypothetical protein